MSGGVAGCGDGYYYLHDPWGWYEQMGFPQPPPWQGLTYEQLLQYPSPTAIGAWVDTVMWTPEDAVGHASALERALSTMAGQQVATQAEVKFPKEPTVSAEETSMRERSAMLGTQQVLEKDKADLSSQLKAAEQQKAELLQTR